MEATKEKRETCEQPEQQQKTGHHGDHKVDIPTDTSPYVQYKDLEDYKMKGYGAEGHLPVVDTQGGGTEGPALSGTGLTEHEAHATDPK